MSLLNLIKFGQRRRGAKVARDRLQIVLSHERAEDNESDFLPKLRNDLITVISKYVKIDPELIHVQLQQIDNCSVLELNIPLPSPKRKQG